MPRLCRIALTVAAAWMSFCPAALSAEAVPPYNQTVETKILPSVERLLLRLVKEGRDMRLDGVAVFNGDDKFLPGKIALGFSELIVHLPRNDPRLPEYLQDFGKIAAMTMNDVNQTWGIYYYLDALDQLRAAGLLDQAVDPEMLARLRVKLDWRSFVDIGSFKLIDLPNNYYGVAVGVARLRERMGWEDDAGAQVLLERMLAHYRDFSGAYGFADETDGGGRFDRYSVLLAGELSQRLRDTGAPQPPELLGWLRKSVDVVMLRLNPKGLGFEYGRSLGPYGETAISEILTAAAEAGILQPAEKDLAYAFASRVGARYASFWLRPETGSLDMWDRGRRTDDYRGKFRILGENLSLAHQFIFTNAGWNALGYKDKPPMAGFDKALGRLPRRTVTWFARGDYDRMLLTLRDRNMVIGLPLVSGADEQHMHNPYFPIPYAPDILSGVADVSTPQLLPRFTLADGSVLEPLVYFKDVKVSGRGNETIVTYRQPQMDKLGAREPIPDDRLSVTVTYRFSPGRITRTDVITPKGNVALADVAMEFATFSAAPIQRKGVTRFGSGVVRSFSVQGLNACHAERVDGMRDYATPTGPFKTKVLCSGGPTTLSKPEVISWTLTYQ